MKKLLKRSGALLIVFAMLLSMTCISAFAADTPAITVSLADGSEAVDVTGGAATVYLAIGIENNPGITSILAKVNLPDGWSLVAGTNGNIAQTMYGGKFSIFLGANVVANATSEKIAAAKGTNVTADGVIMWLPVEIPADTVTGDNYEISLDLLEITWTDPTSTTIEGTQDVTSSFATTGCTVSVIGAAGGGSDPTDPDPDPDPVPPTTGGTIAVGDAELNAADGSVLVPVSITNNPGLATTLLTISIPDGLTAQSMEIMNSEGTEASIAALAGMLMESNLNIPGVVMVSMAGSADLTGDGVLFWLKLALDETATNGDYTLGIEVNQAFSTSDINTNVADTYTAKSGTVTVSGLLEGGTVAVGSAKYELTGTETSVLVPVSITDNPGFASIKLTVSVPEGWTTSDVLFVNGSEVAITSGVLNAYKISAKDNSPVEISFANATNVNGDGVLAWIKYVPGDSVVEGEYPITVTVEQAFTTDDINTNAASAYTTQDGKLIATELKGGTVSVGSAKFELTDSATSVLVPVTITDNPGFASMKLTVSVPEGWTTSDVLFVNGSEVAITSGMFSSYKISAKDNSPVEIAFASATNVTGDGVLAWIKYVPGSSVETGSNPITVTVNEAFTTDDIYTNAAYVYTTANGALNVTELKGGTVTAGTAKFELTDSATSVLVPVSITNNPGFASIKLTVSVPEGWTTSDVYLVNGSEAAITSGMLCAYSISAKDNSDVVITFASAANVTGDGVLAWIKYVPGDSVAEGEYPIAVTVNEAFSTDDIYTNAARVYQTVDGTLNVTERKGGIVTVGTAMIDVSESEQSVLVPVSITSNPGFASIKLTVSVPEGWTTSDVYLVNGSEAAITSGMLCAYSISAKDNSDVVITFASAANVNGDGVLAWIKYVPGTDVVEGEYPITVTVNEAFSTDDIYTNAAYLYQAVDGKIVSSTYTITIADNFEGTADVHAGDNVTMSVTVTGPEFNGAQANVTYDTDLFTYVPGEEEDLGVTVDEEAGLITVTRFYTDSQPSGTVVAELTFQANSVDVTSIGDFEISGTADTYVRAANNDAVPALTTGDSVRIVKQYTVTFLSQDGEVIADYTVDDGAAVTEVPPAPDVDYHTFDKWYIGDTGYTDDEILATAVTADVTYQAGYTANSYAVTLGDGLTDADGNTEDVTATYGVNFTGTITDYDSSKYIYTVTYTVGEDTDAQDAQVNADGTFTIPGDTITGALSVEVDLTAQTYDVTLGDGLTGADTATYDVDYTGTINDYDTSKYIYTVTYTVGEDGDAQDAQVNADGTFTIPGDTITGALSVAVDLTAQTYAVTLGDGLTDAEGNTENVTATYGVDFTGKIADFKGDIYDYIITYKVGDGEEQSINMKDIDSDGSFIIPGEEITDVLNITLTTLTYKVDVVNDYVTGYSLVTVTDFDSAGTTAYSYDGNAMYYVEAYGAYAWIVEGAPTIDVVVEKIDPVSASAGTIVAGYDVNDTGLVDFNDAIAAFGSYMVVDEYPLPQFMAQYLRADVNGDKIVNSSDINTVLGK